MANKRGLSTVVASLMIILLVIVAIGVIWYVVRGVLESGTGEIGLSRLTVNLDIQSAVQDGDNVTVTLKRNAGAGTLLGFKLVFSDGTTSESVEEMIPLDELDTRSFEYNMTSLGVPSATQVSVAPIVENSNGNELLGDIQDTEVFGEGSAGGNGSSGGTGDPDTGTCGDNIIQTPNGDGDTEVCDGTSLDGATCISEGFDGGDLACSLDCLSYDTSSCTTDTPSSCDGVWNAGSEDPGVECDDGSAICVSCVCATGYTADGVGGCLLSSALASGTINSVWPGSAPKYFDSPDLPTDGTESNLVLKYVNVSSSPAICRQIYSANHVVDGAYDMTHLELEAVISGMSGGDTFTVWEIDVCAL